MAHLDYSIAGSRIRLLLCGDGLELYSPGRLPITLDVDSIALRQFTRNELVTNLLARTTVEPSGALGRGALMDKRGEGVPTILRETDALAGRPAVYEVIGDAELRLTLPAADPSVPMRSRLDGA